MLKKCYCLLLCFFVILFPISSYGQEDSDDRSHKFIIGLFTEDLFNGYRPFEVAVDHMNALYPDYMIEYLLFDNRPLTCKDLESADVIFLNENYHNGISESRWLSNIDTQANLIDFWNTDLNDVINNDLYSMNYICSNERPLYFCPIKIDTTVLSLDRDIAIELGTIAIEKQKDLCFSTWSDFCQAAKVHSTINKSGYVFLLEDNFTNLPIAAIQIASYIELCRRDYMDIDKSIISRNLQAIKMLFDLSEIDFVNLDDGSRRNNGLFTSTITLFQSGNDYYCSIPKLSLQIEIYPSNGILSIVPKNAVNSNLGINFINELLSAECHNSYNVMGVLRKDTLHMIHEGYEIFISPQNGNNDIYASSLRYAAFPFLDSAEIIAYHEILMSYITGEITEEKARERIILVIDN